MLRHAAEVAETLLVPLAKRCRRSAGTFTKGIAMRQIEPSSAPCAVLVNDQQSFTEVGLGIARRMHQRHGHLLPPSFLSRT